jgi:hypothetical protein
MHAKHARVDARDDLTSRLHARGDHRTARYQKDTLSFATSAAESGGCASKRRRQPSVSRACDGLTPLLLCCVVVAAWWRAAACILVR